MVTVGPQCAQSWSHPEQTRTECAEYAVTVQPTRPHIYIQAGEGGVHLEVPDGYNAH